MLASRFRATPAPPGPVPTAARPTSAPAGQAALQVEGGPTIGSPRETRVAIEGSAEIPHILEQLAPEQYTSDELEKVGGTFTYTIVLTQSESLLWLFGWCATSRAVVNQNLQDIDFKFSVNGAAIDIQQFHAFDGQSGGLPCHSYVALIYDWPSGDTTLQVIVTFLKTVNDGLSDYSPGTQTFVYKVTAP